MKAIVDRTEPRFEDVRVDLGRGEIGVAEHQLNRPEVGATVEQVCRERMAEHVRAERPRETGAAAVPFENLPETDATERSAACVHEQPRREATRTLSVCDQ